MLEFAGTTRCETRAAEVSQLSRDAAWLLMTLNQGTNKKSRIWGGIVRAPAACEFRIDFPDRINMWEIAITGPKPPPWNSPCRPGSA